MSNLWNYPLSNNRLHHPWHPIPYKKYKRTGTRSTQEKLNILARRILAEQERQEN